ncbi:hypothetical protein T440DRAFT_127913 [Plenodomus tracheiphilus IPT5]|uniref:Uncharacterized protein n=1 Tax=Plenodomus tracheiphilus IPT5 TaxID=1408161 RepID=A0A6A7B478_9PLEO|nr:hypothetical protein T440DRAFT_127913 [Plenodomus tracheiphilus IPT5]
MKVSTLILTLATMATSLTFLPGAPNARVINLDSRGTDAMRVLARTTSASRMVTLRARQAASRPVSNMFATATLDARIAVIPSTSAPRSLATTGRSKIGFREQL